MADRLCQSTVKVNDEDFWQISKPIKSKISIIQMSSKLEFGADLKKNKVRPPWQNKFKPAIETSEED